MSELNFCSRADPYIVLYTSKDPSDAALRLADVVVKMGPSIHDWRTLKNRLGSEHSYHPSPYNGNPIAAWRWPEMEFIPGLSNVTEADGLDVGRAVMIIADPHRLPSFWSKDSYSK